MSRLGRKDVRRGAITLVGIVALVAVALSQAVPRMLEPGGELVVAEFDTAGQLRPRDSVRIAGVTVGRVKDIEVVRGGRSARVRMEIREEGRPLYRDAGAVLRWRTMLGGAVVVDLDPGTPTAGPLGAATIPTRRTSEQVELDDLTSALGGEAQRGMQKMFREMPRALEDPAAPGAALGALADDSPSIAAALRSLRGERDGDLRRLVRTTARTLRALDGDDRPLATLVQGAAGTLRTTGARSAELRRMLELAPAALRRTSDTMVRLRSTLGLADSLVARLHRPAAELGPATRQLRPAVIGADRLLRDATPLLRSLRPALSDLGVAGHEGAPLLEELRPVLRRLDEAVLPALEEVGPRSKRPAYQMIGPLASSLTVGGFDGEGHHFSLSLLPLVAQPPAAACAKGFKAAGEVAACRTLLGVLAGPKKGATP